MADDILNGVLCEVENCKYWEKGNRCSADSIFVVGLNGHKADDVDETGCQTFEKRS
ncbi:MAG TPA: DUF1540 domain-containing protein [Chondromyces sp.]|nr:DUF1540 domain-containing protein [Chondromyces sp.]